MEHRGFATKNRTEEEFIGEVNQEKSEENSYPWDNPEVSARVQKQYNLRLDEVTLEKLRWVGKNVTVSTHQWVVDVLKTAIENKIKELK